VCSPGTSLYLCRLQRGTDPAKSQRFYDELAEHDIRMERILQGGSLKDATEDHPYAPLFDKYRELADQKQTLSFELLHGRRGGDGGDMRGAVI
jgi:hypothetical protein